MKFQKHIQAQFKKAGWIEGRNEKNDYNSIPKFDNLPSFLKEFLYQYGNLKVETISLTSNEPIAILDLTIHKEWAKIDGLVEEGLDYNLGKLYTIGLYRMDSAHYVCDSSGKVFQIGDVQVKMSDSFKEGIEKIISEDYSDTKEWHPDVKEWKEERY